MKNNSKKVLLFYFVIAVVIFVFLVTDPGMKPFNAFMIAFITSLTIGVILFAFSRLGSSIGENIEETKYYNNLKGRSRAIPVYPRPKFVHFYLKKKRLPVTFRNYLEKEYKFYRELNYDMKRVFEHRVASFMEQKTFITRDGLILRHHMKLLISAAAVQVTFGLRHYLLDRFEQFFIYPKKFYSKVTKQWTLGETNPRGAVVFSWEDFLFGMADDNDKLNLGFHEFAHALYVNEKIYDLNPLFGKYYNVWMSEIKRIGKVDYIKEKNIFRRYAFTNHQELFAVGVEVFFEQPQEFRNDLPRMYKILSLMLNQDPLSKEFSGMKRRNVRR